MKVLLLGKGFIGNSLFNYLKDKHDTEIFSKDQLNYTERSFFTKHIHTKKYDVVINCSGYTGAPNVDACEIFKADCLFYNVSIPVQLAKVCEDNKVKFINISSGCIYTGYDKEFTEKDEPNFGIYNIDSSYYSFTKHMCEILLRNTSAITLRIRMPFNSDLVGKNLIYKILNYDNIIDFKNSGTNTDDLNVFIEKLITHNDLLKIKGPLNVVNPGAITAKLISEYLSFNELINPNWKVVPLNELKIVAQRSNCILSDKKIKKLGLQLPSAIKSLKETVALFAEKYKNK